MRCLLSLWGSYRTGNFNYSQERLCWTSYPCCIVSSELYTILQWNISDSSQKKCILFHQLHILTALSSALSSVNTLFMPKKKKEKISGVSSNPETLVTSLLSHPAFLTTKCEFFGEYDLWHSKEKCFTSEQMSLLRCHSSVFQHGQDGSVLEVHEEKILCPEKIVSVLALWCWRREVLRLEKVSWLSSPVERQRRARPGLYVCNTYLHSMLKMFLSLCLQWVLPCPRCYQHCHMLLFFFGWFRYCCPLLALLFPHFFAG